MIRLRFVAALLALGLLSGGFLVGQDKKGDKKGGAKEPVFITKRLPPSYNKLGLTDNQKKQIYVIRAKFALKIEELQKEIAALREQEKTATENILTPAQKARLRELRPGSAVGEKETEKPTGAVKGKGSKGKASEIKKP